MSRKKKINKFLKKYFIKTNRKKTLKVFLEELESNNENRSSSNKVKLSFAIQKPPEKKKIDIEPMKKKDKQKSTLKKKKKVPAEFTLMATKFGLPKEHLEFFYLNRDHFHWEIKENRVIHCSEAYCKFTTPMAKDGLVPHMIEKHFYKDLPCGKLDCEFVAYSQKSLKSHYSRFHGTGNRAPTVDPKRSCKYKSCSYQCKDAYGLELHYRVHENRLLSCPYCPYRSTTSEKMISQHLLTHFDTKSIKCNYCSLLFRTQDAMNRHWQRNHTKDFTCSYCSTTFLNFTRLQRHTTSCEERLKRLER